MKQGDNPNSSSAGRRCQGQRANGRLAVGLVSMMWWCGSGIAAAAIIAQWLRAQPDHRGGGLHLFPQPSITHIHISKDRYKQTQPDAHPYTSPLCIIYTYFQPEWMKRCCNLHYAVYYSCQIFGSQALIDGACAFRKWPMCIFFLCSLYCDKVDALFLLRLTQLSQIEP